MSTTLKFQKQFKEWNRRQERCQKLEILLESLNRELFELKREKGDKLGYEMFNKQNRLELQINKVTNKLNRMNY